MARALCLKSSFLFLVRTWLKPDVNEIKRQVDRHHTFEQSLARTGKFLFEGYRASGKIGSISTGTFFSLSSADFIGGRITAYFSKIALAFS